MMNNIMQQIMNPQEFNYEFNADPLFQAYADMYTQQGRQASLDAQGQAAQLTGGYGNSYGAAVGNQAYQQYLTKLYDKGLDLRDRAYQMYTDDWNKLLNQYGVVNEQDQQGYNQWLNNLNYWSQMAQTENTGHNQDQSYAWQLCQAILANGQMPSAELLAAAGISAADAQAMMAQMEPASGGTGGPGPGGGGGNQYIDLGNGYVGYQDQYGNWTTQNANNVNIQDNDSVMPASTAYANLIGNIGNMFGNLGNNLTGNTQSALSSLQNGLSNLFNSKKKKE